MSGPILLILLTVAVVFIIVATARWKLHPILALLVAAYGLGLAAGLPGTETVTAITDGFGGTIGYIGIVIAAGTMIGVILERSGAALVMAETVLGWIGRTHAALAMGFTGAVVSVPVFCDSGYVILSPLNKALARKSGTPMATLAVMLSMGLYTTHVFVPPTPGPIAAAGELGANLGLVILLGLVTTVPVLGVVYLFALYMGRRIVVEPPDQPTVVPEVDGGTVPPPSGALAFLPIVAPMVLIALHSVAAWPTAPLGTGALAGALELLGNPNTALLLGVGLAVRVARGHGAQVYGAWMGDALKTAGPIILITGAGGALGRVLRETPIADYLGATLGGLDLGVFSILLPFILAAALKTALGSSTVAIITTAALAGPALATLGLAEGLGPVLATLAIGAGAMTVSHANDSYFWVVSQFSGMTVSQAYRLQTLGSAVAGGAGILVVLGLRLVLL
jgi:GntP family gluconate:H+ symporter